MILRVTVKGNEYTVSICDDVDRELFQLDPVFVQPGDSLSVRMPNVDHWSLIKMT